MPAKSAQWERADGRNTFYTINVHLTSKYGSTSLEGDLRPPVNGDVEKRASQLSVIAVSLGEIAMFPPKLVETNHVGAIRTL